MEIVIAFGGMAVTPDVLENKSLGGSETAAICVAKELRKLGHMVTLFCNLATNRAEIDDDGIRWCTFAEYQGFVSSTEIDLLVASRDPQLLSFPHQAKKAVLWVHDLATHFSNQSFQTFSWNIDEVWTVSEYHRKQFSEITGFPLSHIWATRNGIKDVGVLQVFPKQDNTLLYAARPERGLINLVRPGGIMSRLPEYKLEVCFYDNWPDHMRDFYSQLFKWCEDLPNVEILGSLTQKQLRGVMARSAAYVYPTQFEEVSCIIARECMEQRLPIICTDVGALPETVGDCGHIVKWDHKDIGSDEFVSVFAEEIKHTLNNKAYASDLSRKCSKRTDLHWGDVARSWVERSAPVKPKPYSMCKSLIMDGDVFAAYEVAKKYQESYWLNHIEDYYPFVTGSKTIEEHYKGIYELEESKGVPERKGMRTLKGTQRYEEIKRGIADANITYVLEYGCAEGPIILQLAMDYPNKQFYGIDIVESNVELCKKYAAENGITNVEFYLGSTDNWPEMTRQMFDAAIIAEVLEHTLKPWEVTNEVEKHVILGGTMVITVPQGPWEWNGLVDNPSQWPWRAHIWHINKEMIREMFSNKESKSMAYLPYSMANDGRAIGNIGFVYFADHEPVNEIDPLAKAKKARYRQTVSACMIAYNEEHNILRCLKSIAKHVDQINIAVGPSTDRTNDYIMDFANSNPHIDLNIIDVPKIEVGKFGFDDARNASIQAATTDWVFWIDADEYLSGNDLRVYIRNNAFDSYAINQHHFTCEPRGAPTQLDKPARLFRNNGTFRFFGKVHEHAEKGFNGGPGFVMMLNTVDIGHTGYVNEGIRRNRFERNFPLLEWDRKTYPERRIGKFLWFRDLFHSMQWKVEQRDQQGARFFAEQTIKFFKDNKDDFLYIGSGPHNSLHYYSEAMKLLGQGHFVKVHLSMEGVDAAYEGVFESSDEALDIAGRAVKEQIEKRNSRYWR